MDVPKHKREWHNVDRQCVRIRVAATADSLLSSVLLAIREACFENAASSSLWVFELVVLALLALSCLVVQYRKQAAVPNSASQSGAADPSASPTTRRKQSIFA